MPNRNASAALREYLATLHSAATCVTRAQFTHDCYLPAVGRVYSVQFNNGFPVSLKSATSSVDIAMRQRFEVVQSQSVLPFTVVTVQYYYTIRDTQTGHEILAFH